MINLNELTGIKLRKIFGATRAGFQYHNKHKDGSGNFGLNLIFERDGLVDCGCGMKTQDRSIFDIRGEYLPNGDLYSLSFGTLYQSGSRGLEDMNFAEFVAFAKKYIEDSEAERIRKLNEEEDKRINAQLVKQGFIIPK